MITFRTCLISELSLLSGVKRRLDLETPKGGFWRIVLKKPFSLMTENSQDRWCVSLAAR
jgi:hypothetical protein